MIWIAVFDTNVLFSGIGWRGTPFRCLELARAGVVQGVTCPELLDELREKLDVKLRLSSREIATTLDDFRSFLRIVTVPRVLKVIDADPDDDVVLECAAVAEATHIVTGDRRHLLPLGTYQGIAIVTPADFLAAVLAAEPER